MFLTLSRITDINARGIYTDLAREFVRRGHKFYIVKPNERKTGKPTEVTESGGVQILGVRTLNIQKTHVVEKGIGTLLLEGQYYRAINKHWGNIKFDLILYSTPPITFNKVIASLKKRNGAKTYLLLCFIEKEERGNNLLAAKRNFPAECRGLVDVLEEKYFL